MSPEISFAASQRFDFLADSLKSFQPWVAEAWGGHE
jgi:hypothetical protein